MRKIYLTKGLPASGKTTWALEKLKEGNIKRINKDDMRRMMDDSVWSHENEAHIIECRNELIELCILNDFDVIIDDTNLNPKHEETIVRLIDTMQGLYKAPDGNPLEIKLEVIDFTDVSVDECIKRDRNRPNYVGEEVIRGMYEKYIREIPEYEEDPDLPKAIIVDIDGTLAHSTGRNMYDFSMVKSDRKDETVADIITRYSDHHIILVSGRSDICRDETEEWLADNLIVYNELYMRKDGDRRKDVIVKKEIFDKHIKGKFNISFALDDRNQTVSGWRDLGVRCYQVADGRF